jgi:hypothetical protein
MGQRSGMSPDHACGGGLYGSSSASSHSRSERFGTARLNGEIQERFDRLNFHDRWLAVAVTDEVDSQQERRAESLRDLCVNPVAQLMLSGVGLARGDKVRIEHCLCHPKFSA